MKKIQSEMQSGTPTMADRSEGPTPGQAEKKVHHKNWIQKAIKHPGALHRQLGVKQGSKIPVSKIKKAASKGGVLGRRARLAETLRGLH